MVAIIDEALERNKQIFQDAANALENVIHKVDGYITIEDKETAGAVERRIAIERNIQRNNDVQATHSRDMSQITSHIFENSKSEAVNEDVTKRTIVIRPIDRRKNGHQIKAQQNKSNIAFEAGTIEEIIVRPRLVELICTTAFRKKFAKQEVQHHESLNKKLSYADKIIPKNLVIILGVPEGFNDKYIKESVNRILNLNADENSFQLIKKFHYQTSKTNNWLGL